jgi:hypothetical protein
LRDADVRRAVMKRLSRDHRGDSDTRIVQEMNLWAGTVRIDIAVINGKLSGYELKSERDTLARLPVQADIYSRIFDQITLVVGERHIVDAIGHIPGWWGLMQARMTGHEVELSSLRSAQLNPDPDPYLVAELLRKDEAISILAEYDLAKGWRSKRVKEIYRCLAAQLPFPELSEKVRLALKSRQNWLLRQ